MAPAIISFGSWTPTITRTAPSRIPMIPSIIPTDGCSQKIVTAITKTEKTWRLGKDFPFVSFFSTGGIPNFSYGRGALITALAKDTIRKESSGTITALESHGLCSIRSISRYSGYTRNTSPVSIWLRFFTCLARSGFSRRGFVILIYCSFVMCLHALLLFPEISVALTVCYGKQCPDKNKEIRNIKNNPSKPRRTNLKPDVIHNMVLRITVIQVA